MSRNQFFNAATSEAVGAEMPNQNGMDFNLLYGAGPNALPATLGTSQGSNNSNYSTTKNKIETTAATPSNPHGTLVRNLTSDQYTSNAPYFANGVVKNGLVSSLSIPVAQQDAIIGNNVFGKSVYGEPEVQILNYGSTRDTYSAGSNVNPIVTPPNTYAPNATQNFSDVIPSVGSRFYRG